MNSSLHAAQTGHAQLKRLVALRVVALLAQCAMLALARYFLEYTLSWLPMLLCIAALATFNLFSWLRLRTGAPVSNIELFSQLLADVTALSVLLYYAGGSTNPFVSLYLLPLVIAAATLPQRYTWAMAILTIACYTLLMKYYQPLPEIHATSGEGDMAAVMSGLGHDHRHMMESMPQEAAFNMHVIGMWLGFVISAVVVAYFVVRMAHAVRERDEKLARAREETLRNERIVALGMQAASAAHEMGTPLGTMAIIVHELIKEYGETDADLCKKMKILREQVSRCKQALSVLSASAGEVRAESGHPMPVSAYLDEVISNWRQQRPEGVLAVNKQGFEPSPWILAELTLTHALVNILNNSADVSPHFIELRARWTKDRLILEIVDDGPGIAPNVSEQLGKEPVSSKENGLGVGLFLAFTTIERMGGTISMALRTECQGTLTRISLPVALREAGL